MVPRRQWHRAEWVGASSGGSSSGGSNVTAWRRHQNIAVCHPRSSERASERVAPALGGGTQRRRGGREGSVIPPDWLTDWLDGGDFDPPRLVTVSNLEVTSCGTVSISFKVCFPALWRFQSTSLPFCGKQRGSRRGVASTVTSRLLHLAAPSRCRELSVCCYGAFRKHPTCCSRRRRRRRALMLDPRKRGFILDISTPEVYFSLCFFLLRFFRVPFCKLP